MTMVKRSCFRILLWGVTGCGLSFGSAAAEFAAPQPLAEADVSLQDGLRNLLLSRAANSAQTPIQTQVLAFYLARDFVPVWTGEDADKLNHRLARADTQGLRPKDYTFVQTDPVAIELALTETLFRYAHDVRSGRFNPGDVYKDVRLPQHKFDPGPALSAALASHNLDAFFDGLPPSHPQYRQLADALSQYRAIAALGGWRPVAGGDNLALAARLAWEDPALAATSQPSEQDILEALLRYQIRNGLTPDGKAGNETLRQLNIPAATRAGQIVANMERWRWLPARFEPRTVRINVPDQSLDLFDGNDALLHSRVVIGKRSTPTPILRTEILSVVTNPPWDIPDDIAARSLLPHLRKNPDYLASRKMTLVDAPEGTTIDWRKVMPDKLPFQIRQAPGPDNVLGRLMLDSPNDFDVYMHDTPVKTLFDQPARDASNGCIRVEQIDQLAALILGGHTEILEEIIVSGETRSLPLPKPLPVYMLYWTAIAGPDGVGFRPDRYGRDPILLAKLRLETKGHAFSAGEPSARSRSKK